MHFRTEFSIPPSSWKLGLQSRVVSMGSCFAEVLGKRLQAHKIEGMYQPFGTLFSPLALYQILQYALAKEPVDDRLFLERDGRWLHYDTHSSMTAASQQELGVRMQWELDQLAEALRRANLLVLTLGSAWAYRLLEPPTYVANCHKQPARIFDRDLLSVKTICKEFGTVYALLKAVNPGLRVLLTVSPVRHAKDGMMDNSVSKSILRAACHYLVSDYADVMYFPAYELLLDDLRDYRFYASDLVHPSEMAEAYIFEKFQQTYFDASLQQFTKDWEKITKALNHRPFQENSAVHLQFLTKLLTDLERMPVNVSQERAEVSERIQRITQALGH